MRRRARKGPMVRLDTDDLKAYALRAVGLFPIPGTRNLDCDQQGVEGRGAERCEGLLPLRRFVYNGAHT